MQKSILITGCSRGGIGYDVALALQERGYRVFATARRDEEVKHLSELGFEAFRLDVRDTHEVDSVVDAIMQRTDNTLFALFNNAGYGQAGALEDIPLQALKEQFETNVFALHNLTCKVIPIMRAQGYGKIIQHSSVLGLISLRFRGAYNASKYAIEGLCDTLRLELHDTHIEVISLNTGPVRSNFRKNATKKFLEYIDPNSSVFKEAYEKELLARNEEKKGDAFTRDSGVVIEAVIHALEHRAKAHYYITEATKLLATLKRLLPTRWLDTILLKI